MAITVSQVSDSISRVEEIFLNAVTSSRTMELVRNVRGTRDIFSMVEMSTGSNVVQAYATVPSEAGDAAIADVQFTIDKKSINVPFPYDLLKNTEWKETIANIHDQGIPTGLAEEMVGNITAKALAEVESEIWNSNDGAGGSPTGTINGFIKLINDKLTAASLGAQILSATTPTTVPANIQAILGSMVAVVPLALLADPSNTVFAMSPATKYAYTRSLETQSAAVKNTDDLRFGGFLIEVIPNLNSRTIVLGKLNNLGVGTPSAPNDIISLEVIDQKAVLKNQANIFGNFGYGAGAVTTDWVTYEDTTA